MSNYYQTVTCDMQNPIQHEQENLRKKVELLTKLSYNMYYNNIVNEIMNLSDSQFIKDRLIEGLKNLLDNIFMVGEI